MATPRVAPGRLRVGPASPAGMRLVTDRARCEAFRIYPAMTWLQQMHGHEAGLWYFRPLGRDGNAPLSIGYPTVEAALSGLAFTQQFKDSASDEASNIPHPR